MFTGLIEETGKLTELRSRGNYKVLTIDSQVVCQDLSIGDSVSCDGACLTVVRVDTGNFTVEASQETTARTILNTYSKDTLINLERALRVGDRFGGHFVSGHIDCTARLESIRRVGESIELAVAFDRQYDRLVIDKGSIAVNGISLTVNSVRSGWFTVNIIPHTADGTTVRHWSQGDSVNLEFDMIGKYVMKIHANTESNTLTKNKLLESGW